jgi:predicted NBD/HSP70 family sugar kinase
VASSTGVVRVINGRAIYELVRSLGQASVTQIGRESGLSRPTVTLALAGLQSSGLLRQNGRRTGGTGRAPRVFEPNPEAGHVLVVDVGRSWLRMAVANIGGDILLRRDVRARVRSAPALIEQIATMARALSAEAGVAWERLTHKVVGTPGVFDAATGTLRLAPNLPGWERPGVGHRLVERLGGDVTVYNDVNMAALGEKSYGAGRQVRDFIYLSVGTGVGMALVLEGRLREGAHGAAGEVAFLPIFPDVGPARGAERRRGALESVVGAGALTDLAHRNGLTLGSVAEVFDAARQGSAVAQSVVDEAAFHLARAVGAIVSVVDPKLVVLGGGIGHNGDLLIPRIREQLSKLVPLDVPDIVASSLGADAQILGGLSAALEVARRVLVERAGLTGQAV